jgi:superfamily II DNA or RNA helicase
MQHYGADRRAWLVFEASDKAAQAMAQRMNEWGIPTGVVLGETQGARAATRRSRHSAPAACVHWSTRTALTTGFDVQQVDMLVMRRATKSLGLYLQMTGRLLRTIDGNITASSIAAGQVGRPGAGLRRKYGQHGPLDFIRPRATASKLVKCANRAAPNNPSARQSAGRAKRRYDEALSRVSRRGAERRWTARIAATTCARAPARTEPEAAKAWNAERRGVDSRLVEGHGAGRRLATDSPDMALAGRGFAGRGGTDR